MAKPVLGYWELRGRAESIRYLLHYKRIDFEDKRYTADGPGYTEWQMDKLNLGLGFPNLPYYLEGDVKLSQSVAIIRYLGYKHGLVAKTEKRRSLLLLAEQQSVDFRQKLLSFCESGKYETTSKEEFLKTLQPMFQQWEKFLGDTEFMAGDDITYVDFMAFEAFDLYRLYHETILSDYPSLKAYFDRMKNLPELQEYFNSPIRKAWPIFGHKAKFGGGGEPPSHL